MEHFFPRKLSTKLKLLCLLLIFVIVYTLYLLPKNVKKPDRHCFIDDYINNDDYAQNAVKLPDILESERKPKLGETIFFHDTTCSTDGILKLTARQACAIESAAKHNPNSDVFVLFASPTYMSNNLDSKIIRAVLAYDNVFLRNVNLWTYANNTPSAEWFHTEILFKSDYVISHTSDFLRFLTLWRWGGTYLDLDVVVIKNMEKLPKNYAGAEDLDAVDAGVINLAADGFGYRMADLFLKNFFTNFRGNDWGYNGPGVLTRVLKYIICKVKTTNFMTTDKCQGFKVYPKEAFYAIDWETYEYFFHRNYTNRVMNATKNSMVIHVWNNLSKNTPVKVGSNVAYGLYAASHCPMVYSSCGKYF